MNNESKLKKDIKILSGITVFLFIGIILVSSYAFFNYTKTGAENDIATVPLDFDFTDSASVEKGNAFPIATSDIDNTITKTFNITAHTALPDGIKYNVYVIYGDNVTGKTRLLDDVISFEYIPPSDGNGFTTLTNNYSSPTSLTFTNGKALIATGLVKDTSSLTTKTFTTKLWIDSSKINISSTTKRATNAEGNPSLADATSGTTTATRYMRNDTTEASTVTLYPAIESQQGKIIYTTNEFSNSYYSFKIVIEAEEDEPPICTRVTNVANLHTETCTNSNTSYYCKADGYYAEGSKGTTTITYGNAKAIDNNFGHLTVGDAFDCDVNGNGIIDEDGNGNSSERFYYVSEYFNTDTKQFDDLTGYATLIYYNNTYNNNGTIVVGGGYVQYDSSGQNYNGPVTAITYLPTATMWSNVELKTTTRAILAEADNMHNEVTTTGGTLPTSFSYEGKSARLLTAQELMRGCGLTTVNGKQVGELSDCNFLYEKTAYATTGQNDMWLETPYRLNASSAFEINVRPRYVANGSANNRYYVRPVIDVPFSRMEY